MSADDRRTAGFYYCEDDSCMSSSCISCMLLPLSLLLELDNIYAEMFNDYIVPVHHQAISEVSVKFLLVLIKAMKNCMPFFSQ